MSVRRRIKAAAILPPKRNTKAPSTVTKSVIEKDLKNDSESDAVLSASVKEVIPLVQKDVEETIVEPLLSVKESLEKEDADNSLDEIVPPPESIDEGNSVNENQETIEEVDEVVINNQPEEALKKTPECPSSSGSNVFKYPQTSGILRKSDNTNLTVEQTERINDESIIRRDLQDNSASSSSTKPRQRIKATPCFGLRRNSIQGNSSDIEDEPRRQRYLSTSSNHSTSAGSQNVNSRIRTESSSSYMSDYSNVKESSSTKPRKIWSSEESQKLTAAKREFKQRFNGKIPEKTSLRMLDLIYFNPPTKPMKYSSDKDRERRMSVSSNVSIITEREPQKNIVKDTSNDTAMPVPQLKLDANGEVILDEQSLVIATTREKEGREHMANSSVLYYDERSGSQGFYKRHKRTKDWPPEETIKFYKCLHTIGTDFSLMETLFPNRTRRELKSKFKKEERINLNLVNKALTNPKAFNIEELKKELEDEENVQADKKRKWEEVKKKMLESKNEQNKAQRGKIVSRALSEMKHGDCVYENEHILVPPRKRKRRAGKVENIEAAIEKTLENGNLPPISTIIEKRRKQANDNCQSASKSTDSIPEELSTAQLDREMEILLQDDEPPAEGTENSQQEHNAVQSNEIAMETNKTLDAAKNDVISCEVTSVVHEEEGSGNSQERTDSVNSEQTQNRNPNQNESSTPDCEVKREAKQIKEECFEIAQNTLYPTKMDVAMYSNDVDKLLTDLVDGTLVFVSSEDPDSAKVINEIYIRCKETGQLSNEPLDLSEEVLNCILEVMN